MPAPVVDLASFPLTARHVAQDDEGSHTTRERAVCAAVTASLALPGLAASAEPLGASLSYCATGASVEPTEYRIRINGLGPGAHAKKDVEFLTVSLVALAGDEVVGWSEDLATRRAVDASNLVLVDVRGTPVFITGALRETLLTRFPPSGKRKPVEFTRAAFEKLYPPSAAGPFDLAALIAASNRPAGPIAWTRKTRKNLHGFVTKTAFDPPDARKVPTAAEAWEALRQLSTRAITLAHSDSLAPMVSRVVAEFTATTPPAVDPAVEHARAALVLGHRSDRDMSEWDDWAPERAVVNFWAVVGGIEKTLAVLLARGPFWLEETGTSTYQGGVMTSTSTLNFLDAPGSFSANHPFDFRTSGYRHEPAWSALRCHLDALDDAAFAEATRVAHEVRARIPASDVSERAAVAFAFRRDPTHALDELRRFDPSGKPDYGAARMLLLASPTVAAAAPVLETCVGKYSILHDIAFDLVESFGYGAAPIIERSVHLSEDAREAGRRRKSMLAALKLIAP
ncbi:MAG: hypothetical protein U0326_35530 [Polyangiales bacterium]